MKTPIIERVIILALRKALRSGRTTITEAPDGTVLVVVQRERELVRAVFAELALQLPSDAQLPLFAEKAPAPPPVPERAVASPPVAPVPVKAPARPLVTKIATNLSPEPPQGTPVPEKAPAPPPVPEADALAPPRGTAVVWREKARSPWELLWTSAKARGGASAMSQSESWEHACEGHAARLYRGGRCVAMAGAGKG